MDFDAHNCGIDTHVRIRPIGTSLGDAQFRTRTSIYRRKIVVDEEYELVFDDTDTHLELDKTTFDPRELWVATRVQQEFTAFHNCSAEDAISNLRLLVEKSITSGKYRKLDWGGHCFTWRGYLAIVTPNLKTVIRYKTSHYERTPRQVAEGVKSRLSKRRSYVRATGSIPETLALGVVIDGVVSGIAGFGLFIRISHNFDALIHRTQLEWVTDGAEQSFAIGDVVQVEVIDIDWVRNRVSLRLVGREEVEEGK